MFIYSEAAREEIGSIIAVVAVMGGDGPMRQRYIDGIFKEYSKVWESDDVLVEKLMEEMVTNRISGATEEGWDKMHRGPDGGVYSK